MHPGAQSNQSLWWLVVVVLGGSTISIVGGRGEVSLTWIGWLVPLLLSSVIVLFSNDLRIKIRHWALWALVVFFYSVISLNDNALQRGLMLLTPLMIAEASARSRYSKSLTVSNILKALAINEVLIITLLGYEIYIGSVDLDFLATQSIAMVLYAWIFFHAFLFFNRITYLVFFSAALIIPVMSVSRMATAAALSVIVLNLAPMKARHRLLAVIAGLSLLSVVVLSSSFSAKSGVVGFDGLYQALTSGEIQTNGRIAVWQLLGDRIMDAPLFGHGGNSSQPLLRGNLAFDHPHNDWLRLVFEYGFFGVAVFLISIALQTKDYLSTAGKVNDIETIFIIRTAISLYIPFCILMITDNILLYASFFGGIHFFLLGLCKAKTVRYR